MPSPFAHFMIISYHFHGMMNYHVLSSLHWTATLQTSRYYSISRYVLTSQEPMYRKDLDDFN